MDWSKAKSILIIAFIITNIFLAYVLFTIKQDESEIIIEDGLLDEVVELLSKEDISIDTKIPKLTQPLPAISLEYETYKPEEILPRFLGSYQDMAIGAKMYTNGEKIVKFERNNKKLVYENQALEERDNKNTISKDQALKMTEEFINNHGFDLKDAELSFYSEKDKIHKVVYTKVIDGIIVEETNMTTELSSEGIISFERYWTKNIEKGNKNLVVSSAAKSLLRLLTKEEYYGKTIKQIDLCYYFNVDEYKKSISFNDSTGGIASPTWRFIFEDGEKVFLDEN